MKKSAEVLRNTALGVGLFVFQIHDILINYLSLGKSKNP